MTTGVAEFCLYFSRQRTHHGQHVFQFPFHLDAGDLKPTPWASVEEPEQVVIDMRTDLMKTRARANLAQRTLKSECDVWEERPKIVACEEVGSLGLWNQSVDKLTD